jgi:ferredoxin
MLKIDQETCIGCGLCAGTSPEHFIINANGKAEVIKEEVTRDTEEAAKNCPVGAISVK